MQEEGGKQANETVAPQPLSGLLSSVQLTQDRPLVAQIFDTLRNLIVGVELLPGQLVSEKEIAEVLFASKTPVREALIRLEDAGLVTIIPKSGTYVTPIDMDRYLEACFVRLQLETGAVRRAAQHNNDPKAMADLTDLMARQEHAMAAEDYKLFFNLDEDLHRAFFEIAGMPGVWSTVKRVQFDMDRVRHLKRLHGIRRGAQVIKQHWAIVKALQKGAADQAEAALVDHIGSLDSELESLAKHPMLLDHIEKLNSQRSRTRGRRGQAL